MFHPDNRGNATIALKKKSLHQRIVVLYMSRIKINLKYIFFFHLYI